MCTEQRDVMMAFSYNFSMDGWQFLQTAHFCLFKHSPYVIFFIFYPSSLRLTACCRFATPCSIASHFLVLEGWYFRACLGSLPSSMRNTCSSHWVLYWKYCLTNGCTLSSLVLLILLTLPDRVCVMMYLKNLIPVSAVFMSLMSVTSIQFLVLLFKSQSHKTVRKWPASYIQYLHNCSFLILSITFLPKFLPSAPGIATFNKQISISEELISQHK